MAAAIVKSFGGGTSATGLTHSVAVPAGGCALGNHIFVLLEMRSVTATATVADDRGNTYTSLGRWPAAANVELCAFIAPITTALLQNDNITATSSANTHKAMACVELSGASGDVNVSSAIDYATVTTSTVLDPNSVTTLGTDDLAIVGTASVGSPNIGTVSGGYTNQAGYSSTTTIGTVDWMTKSSPATPTENPDNALRWSGSSSNVVLVTFAIEAAGGTTFPVSFTANATGTFSTVKETQKTLSFAAIGSASLIKFMTKSFSTTATGTPSLLKRAELAFSVGASGTADVVRERLSRTWLVEFTANATGTPSFLKAIAKTLSFGATGTVDLPKPGQSFSAAFSVAASVTVSFLTSVIPALGDRIAPAATRTRIRPAARRGSGGPR